MVVKKLNTLKLCSLLHTALYHFQRGQDSHFLDLYIFRIFIHCLVEFLGILLLLQPQKKTLFRCTWALMWSPDVFTHTYIGAHQCILINISQFEWNFPEMFSWWYIYLILKIKESVSLGVVKTTIFFKRERKTSGFLFFILFIFD